LFPLLLQGTLVVPWLSIFKCVPLYALAVAHFTCNIGYYTLLTTLPTYLSTILAFDIKEVSLRAYFWFVVFVWSCLFLPFFYSSTVNSKFHLF